jgi:hypothetical protein
MKHRPVQMRRAKRNALLRSVLLRAAFIEIRSTQIRPTEIRTLEIYLDAKIPVSPLIPSFDPFL